ncbi:hypothetical protein LIA77_01346 [Sarocladium implicatum]|nr:hypothetical protein LIA77_01346 [Sarocladium implicatum]
MIIAETTASTTNFISPRLNRRLRVLAGYDRLTNSFSTPRPRSESLGCQASGRILIDCLDPFLDQGLSPPPRLVRANKSTFESKIGTPAASSPCDSEEAFKDVLNTGPTRESSVDQSVQLCSPVHP